MNNIVVQKGKDNNKVLCEGKRKILRNLISSKNVKIIKIYKFNEKYFGRV